MNKKIHASENMHHILLQGRKDKLLTIVIYMKLTLLFTLLLTVQVFASRAQNVSMRLENATLKSVLLDLRKQTNYSFIVQDEQLKLAKPISVNLSDKPLLQALAIIFEHQPFDYEVNGKVITLVEKRKIGETPKITTKNTLDVQVDVIEGKVVDTIGKAIEDVSVKILGKSIQTKTNAMGGFSIKANPGDIIEFSYIGFKTLRLTYANPASLVVFKTVVLRIIENSLTEVVVTGTGIERNKLSFTGATASFTGEQLKLVGNQNIIASLRGLDPSFIQVENNVKGSNPNVLPTLELRGQTSISVSKTSVRDEFSGDPNLPLFILDGFESNLRAIVDLDMNIVQSVTILKDASSTAIYGSRASNGVVVVETIKPAGGKISLSYTADLNLEMPDLGSYNMMNAKEKLDFERLSGRYTSTFGDFNHQLALDNIYNERLKNVIRGVDSYWLDKPLQTGYSSRHSVNARGGQGALIFNAGFNYKDTKGVMIGSGRKDYGGNINLSYRSGNFNLTNNVTIGGSNSANSSYGSFSAWVNTNPYFEFLSADQMFLSNTPAMDLQSNVVVYNPMYNASLNSFSKGSSFSINNNTQLSYQFNKYLKLTTSGQIRKSFSNNDNFTSPLSTLFTNVETGKKGTLIHDEGKASGYTANMMLTFARVFNEKHSLTANLRTEISENQNRGYGFTTEGFPAASNGNPAFAFGFPTDATPNANTRVSRRNSALASVNYSYDQRFNADVNFNMDGSTAFGSNKLYSPYYSAGLGWNIHREQFFKNIDWIDVLRIRGNIGITGNQSFSSVSQSVYNYSEDLNRSGQGIYLDMLGAPDLAWQSTRQTSIGLDLGFMKKRLNIQFNAYDKYTDPMVVDITLPTSTGLASFPYNTGALTVRGLETNVSFSPIFKPKEQIVWTLGLTGAILDQKYSKFENKLKSLNESLQQNNSLTRYKDGYSPRDIWAVPSLGIDPVTGREIFLTKDGRQTFNYSANDIVKVGNS
ncbi:MAG TPA: SusC/RagA family TonB-linked outer membrane protein, partial [Pedobacter sp.]|nr:SusC/RagA family TonB-linked outer membrane protein [Pedobacter sp.]